MSGHLPPWVEKLDRFLKVAIPVFSVLMLAESAVWYALGGGR